MQPDAFHKDGARPMASFQCLLLSMAWWYSPGLVTERSQHAQPKGPDRSQVITDTGTLLNVASSRSAKPICQSWQSCASVVASCPAVHATQWLARLPQIVFYTCSTELPIPRRWLSHVRGRSSVARAALPALKQHLPEGLARTSATTMLVSHVPCSQCSVTPHFRTPSLEQAIRCCRLPY